MGIEHIHLVPDCVAVPIPVEDLELLAPASNEAEEQSRSKWISLHYVLGQRRQALSLFTHVHRDPMQQHLQVLSVRQEHRSPSAAVRRATSLAESCCTRSQVHWDAGSDTREWAPSMPAGASPSPGRSRQVKPGSPHT